MSREVLFLYARRFVPDDILAAAVAQVPAGFSLRPVEQGAPACERRDAFALADYVIAYPGDPSAEELAASPKLKLFQLLSAGYDWIDLQAFRRHGIGLANNGGSNATATAEHTVLLMLALLKRLPLHDSATKAGRWLGMEHTGTLRELKGKTVGLIGFGKIGQEVAKRVAAFDAAVQYCTRSAAADHLARKTSFQELLATSDIVSLHAPLTPETRFMIGAGALAAMKPGSLLINTARGALVDEPALVSALQQGKLAGAGIDTFGVEPVAVGSALLTLPNVVLTPHIAGVTVDTWARRMNDAWANLQRVEDGQPPRSLIVQGGS